MPIIPGLSRGCKKEPGEKVGADLKQVCEAKEDKVRGKKLSKK